MAENQTTETHRYKVHLKYAEPGDRTRIIRAATLSDAYRQAERDFPEGVRFVQLWDVSMS